MAGAIAAAGTGTAGVPASTDAASAAAAALACSAGVPSPLSPRKPVTPPENWSPRMFFCRYRFGLMSRSDLRSWNSFIDCRSETWRRSSSSSGPISRARSDWAVAAIPRTLVIVVVTQRTATGMRSGPRTNTPTPRMMMISTQLEAEQRFNLLRRTAVVTWIGALPTLPV